MLTNGDFILNIGDAKRTLTFVLNVSQLSDMLCLHLLEGKQLVRASVVRPDEDGS